MCNIQLPLNGISMVQLVLQVIVATCTVVTVLTVIYCGHYSKYGEVL